MNHLEDISLWATSYEFTPQQLEYATILQLKILDEKCQMSLEDQAIFKAVYLGIQAKRPSPLNQIIHKLIQDASSSALACKSSYKETIRFQRQSHEAQMQRPIMKAYKAQIRKLLETH